MTDSGGSTVVGGDQIKVGDISGSVAAIGQGAQVIYHNVERALTSVEVAEQSNKLERQRLAEAVTTHVQRLQKLAERPTQESISSPYRALLEYDIDDAALFYGRSHAIRALLDRMGRGSLTVLHAESGAGKTSLLKAGIEPRLLAAGSVPIYVRPYQTPGHYAIKRALLPQLEQTPGLAIASLHDFMRYVTDLLGGQPVVVLLDQFEEIFTVQRPEARAEFISELAPCLDDDLLPARWLFALRSEWFGKLGTFRPDIKNPFANEYLLRALNADEAREIIVEPVQPYGVTYEEGLVSRLIADLGEQDIAPPQLQLVCSALFDARPDSGAITPALYDSLGGTSGILRNHLDRVLSREVAPEHRDAARRLLEALVSSDKRRVLRSREELQAELAAQGIGSDVVQQVLHALIESRLLRMDEIGADQATVGYELAHDYLLDEIELDPAAQARKAAQELLRREVESYQRYGTLLSADKLLIIEAQDEHLVLDAPSQALLDKSRRALARQRRNAYVGVGFVVLLIALAIFSVITTLGATRLRTSAESTAAAAQTQSSDAQRAQSTADAGILDAQAQGTQIAASASDAEQQAEFSRGTALALQVPKYLERGDIVGAYRTAAQAWLAAPGPESQRALMLAAYTGFPDATINVGRDTVVWYVNHDGSEVMVGQSLINMETGESRPLKVPGTTIYNLAYVADGTRILIWVDEDFYLLDADTGEQLVQLELSSPVINWYILSADGQRMYVLFEPDGEQQFFGVFSLTTGEMLNRFDVGEASTRGPVARFEASSYIIENPVRPEILLMHEPADLSVWNYETGEMLWRQTAPPVFEFPSLLGYSSDGAYIYGFAPEAETPEEETPIRVLDSTTGEVSALLDPSIEYVFAPSNHPYTFSVDKFGTVSIHMDSLLQSFVSPSFTPKHYQEVIFSGDGKKFGWLDDSGSVNVRLDELPRQNLMVAKGPFGRPIPFFGEQFSGDSRYLFTLSEDGTIARWNLAEQTATHVPIPENGPNTSVSSISPDARMLLLGTPESSTIFDTVTGESLHTIEDFYAFRGAFSEDGTRLALSGVVNDTDADVTIAVWDTSTWEEIARFSGGPNPEIALNADGTKLVSVGLGDEESTLWDVNTGQLITELNPHLSGYDTIYIEDAEFLPDNRIALSSSEGVMLWSPDGQEQIWESVGGGSTVSGNALMFVPETNTLIQSQGDTLSWVNIETGALEFELSIILGWENEAASPSGHYVFLEEHSGTITVLDGENGLRVIELNAGVDLMSDMIVSPAEDYIVTIGKEPFLVRWPIGGDLLYQIVEDRLARLGLNP